MASAGGKRAVGTDGQDSKYRQRVDEHYKVMAKSRTALKKAGRIQLACALGITCVTGTSLVGAESFDPAWLALCFLTASVSAITGMKASGAASAQQPGKPLQSYRTMCKVQLALLFATAVMLLLSFIRTAQVMQLLVLLAWLTLGLLGSLIGLSSASSLASAFEEQASKKSNKAS